jgi:hypothetical protein
MTSCPLEAEIVADYPYNLISVGHGGVAARA